MIDNEIELVGGPFCGVILHPHAGCVHTVLEALDGEAIQWNGPSLPEEVELLEPGLLMVGNQQFGDSLYRMETGRRWQYVPMETSLV